MIDDNLDRRRRVVNDIRNRAAGSLRSLCASLMRGDLTLVRWSRRCHDLAVSTHTQAVTLATGVREAGASSAATYKLPAEVRRRAAEREYKIAQEVNRVAELIGLCEQPPCWVEDLASRILNLADTYTEEKECLTQARR
jgi:hypothetical protein